MYIILDVGNTNLHGYVYTKQNENTSANFPFIKIGEHKIPSNPIPSESDIFDFFSVIKSFIQDKNIIRLGLSSVVPEITKVLEKCISDLVLPEPFYMQASNVSEMKFMYDDKNKLGADRIAAALGAKNLYPKKNCIVLDLGTATTIDAISCDANFLGGVIVPGPETWLSSLKKNTALLPKITHIEKKGVIGNNTVDCINAGFLIGYKGVLENIINEIKNTIFFNQEVIVCATGGWATFFQHENLFDVVYRELIPRGILSQIS